MHRLQVAVGSVFLSRLSSPAALARQVLLRRHYFTNASPLARLILDPPSRVRLVTEPARLPRTSNPDEKEARSAKQGRPNTMRKGVTIFLLVTIVVLGFAVHSVWTLLGLLVATGREDAILRGELPAPNSGTINDRKQLIPKIIHQTYINESIPTHWMEPQQSCLDLHPDYEYKLWTDKKSREFIAAEYVHHAGMLGTTH